ncbi:DinB family protein [Streptomyces clavuligerus]|uniref:DinB family protein n=1 Tax=Streptomyces clavuligerus TaxID=1901 RepID=UPI0035AB722B
MFVTADDDPRGSAGPEGVPDGERATLAGFLRDQRRTLELKCAGLSEEQLRTASVEPSSMSLLGLVQHMEEVERNWFQRTFAGLDAPPRHPEDNGFTVAPGRGAEETFAGWRAAVARSREIVAGARSLDESGAFTEPEAAEALGDSRVSLRWVLIHMVEEYARHNGHADLLRERLDGTTGV